VAVAVLCAFILAVLSLYWGSLYNAIMNLNSLVVYIVDFETESDAIVGPTLVKLSQEIVATNKQPHLGFVTVPAAAFGHDPMQVREAIFSEEAWAALIVNSNATRMLRQAVETGNSSYDPLGACQLIYIDSRDQETWYNYILPQINQFQLQFTSRVGKQWAAEVFKNTALSRANLQMAPQAVSPAVGFSEFNLRPFYPYQSIPSVSVGLIYLIIVSFFAYSFFLPIHMKFRAPQGGRLLHYWQFILRRWLAAINSYFFLSLAYSLVSLAFQIPFSDAPAPHTEVATNANPFNKGTFVVYWMLNFVYVAYAPQSFHLLTLFNSGMAALGMACENVAMIVGFPWTAMWLIFFVITNVTTSFYAIELEPAFYRWGYAFPLHNIVDGSRTLIFGLHSRLGLNFGILFAWMGLNTFMFSPLSVLHAVEGEQE
jgi:uncharacterized membrane protein (DUF485 family)